VEVDHAVIAYHRHPARIVVPEALLRLIRPGGKEEAGVLLGRVEGESGVVEEAWRLAEGVGSFRLNPVEWMRAVLRGEEMGLEYLGIYHTHPGGPPRPSPLDVRYMMECPGEVWLIVTGEGAAAWTWVGGGVKQLELHVA